MTEIQSQSGSVNAQAPNLSQIERLTNTFISPSKTFIDIRDNSRSWWLPYLIYVLTGYLLFAAVSTQVTWQTIVDNNNRMMPEFARKMIEQQPPEKRAEIEKSAPKNQMVTWALAPLGLLIIDLIAAGILLGTINFGFGGKAKYSSVLAVIIYAGLVEWPIKLIMGAITLYAGALPDAFMPGNPAPTNLAYFMNPVDSSKLLYTLARSFDVVSIWALVLTSIGIATVAGVKRNAGYYAVFGWWIIILLISIGFSAMM